MSYLIQELAAENERLKAELVASKEALHKAIHWVKSTEPMLGNRTLIEELEKALDSREVKP